MYTLEYKQLYIPPRGADQKPLFSGLPLEAVRRMRGTGALEQIKATKKRPEEWRVVPLADSV